MTSRILTLFCRRHTASRRVTFFAAIGIFSRSSQFVVCGSNANTLILKHDVLAFGHFVNYKSHVPSMGALEHWSLTHLGQPLLNPSEGGRSLYV